MPIDMKAAICRSASELLTKKRTKKLTVKDIVEECGITRQTFYYHFQDIPDLICYMMEQGSKELLENCLAQPTLEDKIRYLLSVALNAHPLIQRTISTSYQSELEPLLLEQFYSFFDQLTNESASSSLVSDSLTADEAILDAELVKSVPPSITADTGMDVFTHALESYVSIDHNEFSSALAEKSIEICGVFLLRAYLDGSDMHARQKMHVASCLAGLSFNTAGLGITHSMAHQLGAMFHIPHGRANAMLLPHIVEFNANINKHSRSQKEYLPAVKRYANIAHILGLSNYNKVMSVRSLVNWIQFMLKEMNIPLTIQEIGTITPDAYFAAIDKMAEAALADACTPTNPRVPTKEDIIKIYTKLWSF